jgi:hypothetical protein
LIMSFGVLAAIDAAIAWLDRWLQP